MQCIGLFVIKKLFVPWCWKMISLVIPNPNPASRVFLLSSVSPRTNLWKIRGWSSSDMPQPMAIIDVRAYSPSLITDAYIWSPLFENLGALKNKFSVAWCKCPSSPETASYLTISTLCSSAKLLFIFIANFNSCVTFKGIRWSYFFSDSSRSISRISLTIVASCSLLCHAISKKLLVFLWCFALNTVSNQV
jgi:hypothetical protein